MVICCGTTIVPVTIVRCPFAAEFLTNQRWTVHFQICCCPFPGHTPLVLRCAACAVVLDSYTPELVVDENSLRAIVICNTPSYTRS